MIDLVEYFGSSGAPNDGKPTDGFSAPLLDGRVPTIVGKTHYLGCHSGQRKRRRGDRRMRTDSDGKARPKSTALRGRHCHFFRTAIVLPISALCFLPNPEF